MHRYPVAEQSAGPRNRRRQIYGTGGGYVALYEGGDDHGSAGRLFDRSLAGRLYPDAKVPGRGDAVITAIALALVAMMIKTAAYVRLAVIGAVDGLGSVGILFIVGLVEFRPVCLCRHCPDGGP